MEVFVLHILKLNIIAAIVILLVKLLARPLKNKVSARWKYFIWMFVVLSLLIPIRLPAAFSIVDFKVQQSVTESGGQRKVQTAKVSDTAQPVSENTQNFAGVSIQKPPAIHENGKWTGIAAGIFLTVWVIVAILKMAGEFVAYCLSVKNLERMSLPVSDPVSIQIYRKACRNRHIRKAPELRQNAGLTTPLLAGLFRTRLYLPATGYSAEERKLVFYHELTHYYHKDLWYKMLLRIGASVYWFNPFLLLMLKEADEDIENLCDTAVVHSVNKKECSIRKLRRGILPGILMAALLAGGNLAFNISSELTEAAVSAGTERTGQAEGNEIRNENPMQQPEKTSELVDMQEITETQSGQDDTEVTATENMSQNVEKPTEKNATEMSSVSDGENNAQATENTTSENDYPTDGDGYYYEQLPDGVPYTSGFSGSSGVASIVAAGEGDTESRVLYDNGNGTYSDDNGFRYSYQGNGTWADANGNSYSTWNDEDYNFGIELEQRELQGVNGTVDIKETTNGDYYYRDSNGVGYTDNGDGTWTDENGNTYTE